MNMANRNPSVLSKKRAVAISSLSAVAVLFALWGGALLFAVKEAKIVLPVDVTVNGFSGEQSERVEMFRITPRSFRLEPMPKSGIGAWNTSKYCNGLVMNLPDDVFSEVGQIDVRIGGKSFSFTAKSLGDVWKRIGGKPGYSSFEAPGNIRFQGKPSVIPQFSRVINWPGDFAVIMRSFNFMFIIPAVCAGAFVFLLRLFSRKTNFLSFVNELRQNQRVKLFIIIVCSLGVGFYLFGANLKAAFGIDSDHEIIHYLGEDGKLSLNEIPHILFAPDHHVSLATFGKSTLYRPSFTVLRVIETGLYGKNEMLWYLSRILIFSFFIMTLWCLLAGRIGFFYAFVFTAAVISYEYWAHIFGLIHPAEVYGVLGLSLYFLGFFGFYEKIKAADSISKGTAGEWFLMVFGALIVTGAKENTSFLVNIPVIYLLILSIVKRRFTFAVLANSLIILVYSFFVLLSLFLAVSKQGSDFYGRSVSLAERANVLKEALSSVVSVEFAAVGACLCAGFMIMRFLGSKGPKTRGYGPLPGLFLKPLMLVIILYFVYVTQCVLYNCAQWPTGMHYDFPVMLVVNLFYLSAIISGLRIVKFLGASGKVVRSLKLLSLLFFMFLIAKNSLSYNIRDYVKQNAENTRAFKARLQNISRECSKDPRASVILESFSSADYEFILSLTRYFEFSRIKNPLFLDVHYLPESSPDRFHQGLTERLISMSREGGEWGMRPLRELNARDDRCYVIEFSGSSDKYSSCKNLGRSYQAEIDYKKIPEGK